MDDAACKGDDVDPDIFFPEKTQIDVGNEAIRVCFSCSVRSECLEYRKRTGTGYGIWAGIFTKRHGAN